MEDSYSGQFFVMNYCKPYLNPARYIATGYVPYVLYLLPSAFHCLHSYSPLILPSLYAYTS